MFSDQLEQFKFKENFWSILFKSSNTLTPFTILSWLLLWSLGTKAGSGGQHLLLSCTLHTTDAHS